MEKAFVSKFRKTMLENGLKAVKDRKAKEFYGIFDNGKYIGFMCPFKDRDASGVIIEVENKYEYKKAIAQFVKNGYKENISKYCLNSNLYVLLE